VALNFAGLVHFAAGVCKNVWIYPPVEGSGVRDFVFEDSCAGNDVSCEHAPQSLLGELNMEPTLDARHLRHILVPLMSDRTMRNPNGNLRVRKTELPDPNMNAA
jgi:hypothetical protein